MFDASPPPRPIITTRRCRKCNNTPAAAPTLISYNDPASYDDGGGGGGGGGGNDIHALFLLSTPMIIAIIIRCDSYNKSPTHNNPKVMKRMVLIRMTNGQRWGW